MLLLIIGLYMILNYGFMQIRIPPTVGGGVPIGEIVLVVSLLTMNVMTQTSRIFSIVHRMPFYIWWYFGIGSALCYSLSRGMWALRDATNYIESLFIIVGFAFSSNPRNLDKFFKWLPKVLVIISVYAMLYPFRHELANFSPTIVTGNGQIKPLLFNFVGTQYLLLVSAAYLVLFKLDKTRYPLAIFITAIFLVGYSMFLFQARTIYLQIIFLIFMAGVFRPRHLELATYACFLTVMFILIISFMEIKITGRLGQTISMEFLIDHFIAISGQANEEGLKGAAGGVSQRFGWWLIIYERWSSSMTNILFGLGFGMPLVDFNMLKGVVVREPHNSMISVTARTGLLGALAFIWLHCELFYVWIKTYRIAKRRQWRIWENRLLIMGVYFGMVLLNTVGEDALEKPFFAIPYYFFWGVVIGIYWQFKTHVEQDTNPKPHSPDFNSSQVCMKNKNVITA